MRDQVERTIADPRIRQAFDFVSEQEAQIEADQIRLSCIAASPFGEAERATAFAEALQSAGLRPFSDAVGNVIAAYDDVDRNPVVVAAHLDTVFPASTSLHLRRKNRADRKSTRLNSSH